MTPAELPPLRDLVAALDDVEERLARLLVSGWRNAAAEARDLSAIADALAAANLPETAARVRAVAEATSAEEGLRAVALASNACRLARAQLAEDLTPQGRWRSLTGSRSS